MHDFKIGDWVRVNEQGILFQHLYQILKIQGDVAHFEGGRLVKLEHLIPCCTKKNTKVGDIVQMVSLSRRERFDRDAEVLNLSVDGSSVMRVKFLDTSETYSEQIHRFALKRFLYPEILPEEPEEVPLSLGLFFGGQ